MQLKFGDKREVRRKWVGVLPVSEKEGERKGKNGIGPRMKNGRANHKKKYIMTSQLSALAGGLSFKKAKSYYYHLFVPWKTHDYIFIIKAFFDYFGSNNAKIKFISL